MIRASARWSVEIEHGATRSTAGLFAGIVSTFVSPPWFVRASAINGLVFWRLVVAVRPHDAPVSTLKDPLENGRPSLTVLQASLPPFGPMIEALIDVPPACWSQNGSLRLRANVEYTSWTWLSARSKEAIADAVAA